MDARDALMVGTTSEGKPVRRPLSPHLQVYRPQITSAMSIFHRITGVGLGLGTLVMVWWLVGAAGSERTWGQVQWFLGSWLGILLLVGWTAALWYHFFNGLRHLWWDAGRGMTIPEVEKSGKLALGATALATVLSIIVAVAY